jgi:hypothetical protein
MARAAILLLLAAAALAAGAREELEPKGLHFGEADKVEAEGVPCGHQCEQKYDVKVGSIEPSLAEGFCSHFV